MPKVIEYPRASFQRVLEMAEAIDYLGGKCSVQSCADKLNVKVTGAFTALIGAAKKHGLVDTSKSNLVTTEIYKNIKLSYDDEEKRHNLRIAFLTPPTYSKVYEQFKGRELPIQMLDKLFIREFGVDGDSAQRISNYFIDGARLCELLVDNKLIDTNEAFSINEGDTKSTVSLASSEVNNQNTLIESNRQEAVSPTILSDSYVVHIYGPGMNSKLTISEEEDLIILDAMISKLKKRMKDVN